MILLKSQNLIKRTNLFQGFITNTYSFEYNTNICEFYSRSKK